MVSARAQARIGQTVRVLIEDAELQEGRAAQGEAGGQRGSGQEGRRGVRSARRRAV